MTTHAIEMVQSDDNYQIDWLCRVPGCGYHYSINHRTFPPKREMVFRGYMDAPHCGVNSGISDPSALQFSMGDVGTGTPETPTESGGSPLFSCDNEDENWRPGKARF